MESPDPMSKFHEGPGGLKLVMGRASPQTLMEEKVNEVELEREGRDYGLLNKTQSRVLRTLHSSINLNQSKQTTQSHPSPSKLMKRSWTEDLEPTLLNKENQPNALADDIEIVRHLQPRPPPPKPSAPNGSEQPFRRSRRGMGRIVTMAASSTEDEGSPPQRDVNTDRDEAWKPEALPTGNMEDESSPPQGELNVNGDGGVWKPEALHTARSHVSPTSVVDMGNMMGFGDNKDLSPKKGGNLIVDITSEYENTTRKIDEDEGLTQMDAWGALSSTSSQNTSKEEYNIKDGDTGRLGVAICVDQKEEEPQPKGLSFSPAVDSAHTMIHEDAMSAEAKDESTKMGIYPVLPGMQKESIASEWAGSANNKDAEKVIEAKHMSSTCPRAQRPSRKRRHLHCGFKAPITHSLLDVICEDATYTSDKMERPEEMLVRQERCVDGVADAYRQWLTNQCRGTATLEIFSLLYKKDFKQFKTLLSAYEEEKATFPVDENQNTLLMAASFLGFRKVARYLIRKGVDINAQNGMGNTALHFAREMNHFSIVDMLTKKGADGLIQNYHGNTFYDRVMLSSPGPD